MSTIQTGQAVFKDNLSCTHTETEKLTEPIELQLTFPLFHIRIPELNEE